MTNVNTFTKYILRNPLILFTAFKWVWVRGMEEWLSGMETDECERGEEWCMMTCLLEWFFTWKERWKGKIFKEIHKWNQSEKIINCQQNRNVTSLTVKLELFLDYLKKIMFLKTSSRVEPATKVLLTNLFSVICFFIDKFTYIVKL